MSYSYPMHASASASPYPSPPPAASTPPRTTHRIDLGTASSSDSMERGDSSSSAESSVLTFEEFIDVLPETIHRANKGDTPISDLDHEVSQLFRRLNLTRDDWERFAFFDGLKNYTRNLVATDHETFTLLLLCWTRGKESPIHDHPCDGCWLRVCEGTVMEKRYKKEEDGDCLQCFSNENFTEGQIAYITDSMGYHKVGNPSASQPAVTLHLYSPPFERCKIWLNPSKASKPSQSSVCYYSEYGDRVEY